MHDCGLCAFVIWVVCHSDNLDGDVRNLTFFDKVIDIGPNYLAQALSIRESSDGRP
jgi:hypothetical protein